MKKTLQISIAKVLFTIEEDAYTALDVYLASVKEHFAHAEGSEEIVSDIESRIAEQLLESKQKIITLGTVEKILSSIGKVEDFDDKENIINDGKDDDKEEKNSEKDKMAQKKLYRNPDDVIIAGVCSGLAMYFGIDTVLMRIIFVALTFISGFGVFLYFILWLIMPLAKTGAQKLEMSGSPVTLETISSAVNERVEEIKKNKSSTFKKIISFPFKIIGLIFKFIFKIIVPTFRIFLGILLVIIALCWLVGTVVAGGFLFSGASTIDGVSLNMLVNNYLGLTLVISLVLALLIPGLFTFLGGISLLRKKIILPNALMFSLFGIWFIVLFVSAFGVTKVIHNYDVLMETSPAYEQVTRALPILEQFESVRITDGINIKVVEGKVNELGLIGREANISKIKSEVVDGVLIISREPAPSKDRCLFCITGLNTTTLTLTVVDVPEMMTIERGSSLQGDFTQTEPLAMIVKNGSHADIVSPSKSINIKISDGSRLNISNDITADSMVAIVENGSNLDADQFSVDSVQISSFSGSLSSLRVEKKLKATLENGSTVTYIGDPEITEKVSSGSTLRAKATNYESR